MELIGLIGYGIAAIVYLIFFLLLVVAKQPTFASKIALLACIGSLVVLALSGLQIYLRLSLQYILLIEILKVALWCSVFLSINYGVDSLSSFFKHKLIRIYIIAGSLAAASISVSVILFANYDWLFLILLVLNLLGLVLLEQLFRNHKKQLKWAIWPLVVGMGMIFVFDFVMFAQAAMLQRLDFDYWYIRGFLAAIVVPLLVLTAKRMKDWTPDLFISRDVVFYSSMIMLSGVYLLILAFSGYVLRFIGTQWSDMLSTVFMLLGLLVLVTLLITNSLRSKVKVFISKHFFANKFDYRLEWLKLISAIEKSESKNIYEIACYAMRDCMHVNYCGFISIKNSQLVVTYSGDYVLTDELLKELHICHQFCLQQSWIIDIQEYQNNSNLYPDLKINAQLLLNNQVSAVVPAYREQELIGYFLLSQAPEKAILNWEDRDYLFAGSKQLAMYISLHEAQQTVAQSQQFAVYHRMSAFVLHDLKNIQAQLDLINSNATKHSDNPEFVKDVFATVDSAAKRLNKVVTQLRSKSPEPIERKYSRVNVNNVIVEAVHSCAHNLPLVENGMSSDLFLNIDEDRLLEVLVHLLENAQQACNGKGHVLINGKFVEDRLVISIEDNGCGMSDEFMREQLFQPFITTKGNAGMGIGVYEAQQFVEENNGVLQVQSKLDVGTTFTLDFPANINQGKE